MGSKLKNSGLVALGVVAGIAVSMQFSALAQKTVDPSMPLDELRQLADVYGLIKSDYVEPVEDKKLLTEAISGMVASLDPHSAYLDKKAYRELREGTQGRFVGLGIEIGQSEDGYIKIVAPIEDSPAYRAGIKAGDLITRIDSASIQGLALDEAIKKMRGEPHTKVTLTVLRKDEPAPLSFIIQREEIIQKSVKAKMVEPGYAWLRISQFQEPTVDDMAAKIVTLYKQDPNLKGLVLDLRNDPGGVLQGAIGVAAAFLPKDAEIVSTNGQLADSKQNFYGRAEFYSLRGDSDPLAHLPAAVKDIPARYYTPLGRSIQAKGIVPDFAVDENADGDGLNSLRTREADLDKHLVNDRDKETARASRDEAEEQLRLLAAERKRKPLEYGSGDDFQLAQAIKHLKGLPMQLSKGAPTTLAHQDKPAPAH